MKPTITIIGFDTCGYYQNAMQHMHTHNQQGGNKYNVVCHAVKRTEWPKIIDMYATKQGINHTTSPLVFHNSTYVGGCDALLAELSKQTPFHKKAKWP